MATGWCSLAGSQQLGVDGDASGHNSTGGRAKTGRHQKGMDSCFLGNDALLGIVALVGRIRASSAVFEGRIPHIGDTASDAVFN